MCQRSTRKPSAQALDRRSAWSCRHTPPSRRASSCARRRGARSRSGCRRSAGSSRCSACSRACPSTRGRRGTGSRGSRPDRRAPDRPSRSTPGAASRPPGSSCTPSFGGMMSWPGICMHLPVGSNFRPWYMQRTQSPSTPALRELGAAVAAAVVQRDHSPAVAAIEDDRLLEEVRSSSLPSMSSWSQAATYQQFFRNISSLPDATCARLMAGQEPARSTASTPNRRPDLAGFFGKIVHSAEQWTGTTSTSSAMSSSTAASAAPRAVLRRPKSSVSAAVARLEGRLGTRVIERTTRRLRATEAGESLYHEMAPLFRAPARGARQRRRDGQDGERAPAHRGALRIRRAPPRRRRLRDARRASGPRIDIDVEHRRSTCSTSNMTSSSR